MSAYLDREQTQAKHFILKGYLQALAYKVLRNWDVVYIDGFCGPWGSETADFSDTSFKIALDVLREAQRIVAEQTGTRRRIKCFFSEKKKVAYNQMVKAVMPFNQPDQGFEIKTFNGEFEDAVDEIRAFIGTGFPLIFIDPTGWTGYSFGKIAPLFEFSRVEVLINFMHSFASRFPNHPDPNVIASFDPILGGPDWRGRLDPTMNQGLAMEKLFRDNLKAAGKFSYVVSTRIDKSTVDRPHFFLAYGTKDRAGLIAFREIEFKALKEHARNRAAAITRKRETRAGAGELFGDFEANRKEATITELVEGQAALAKDRLLQLLIASPSIAFTSVVDVLLQEFMLRETNVKDVCVALAAEGKIENSWGARPRKPNDQTIVHLVS